VAPRASRLGLAALLVFGTLACVQLAAPTRREGRVIGRVALPGAAGLGAAAVFLEPEAVSANDDPIPAAVISQRDGRFEPAFAVVAVGQPVLFVNRDKIFQGAFSYSTPNAFECRPFAPGELCMVTFGAPGAVRVYSPLDQSPIALLYVVPGRHHAVPNAAGEFRIDAVPPGRYRATVWTERYGGATRAIAVAPGASQRADFAMPRPSLSTGGPSEAAPAAPEE
jgi:hypothetical protein